MKILVTGATGFIGSHLVRRLLRNGYDVTALVRRSSSLRFLPKNIPIIYGDIRDLAAVRAALKGFDVVFHNAALVCDWGKKEDFYQINVEGTRNVLAGIEANGIKRLILTSTVGVLGEEDCTTAKTEESPYNPQIPYFLSRIFESDMNHYRFTKMMAERQAIAFCKQHSINLTCLRPTWVYGPREFHAGLFCFAQALLSRIPLIPVGRNNYFHVVYVEDVVRAMVAALEKNLEGIHTFIIGNEHPPFAKDYIGMLSTALGVKMPRIAAQSIFYPIGFLLELVYKLCNIKAAPLLTRARVKMFYCNNIYDTSKARGELDFVAQTPLDVGIAKTVRWWRQNKFLEK
ncbi:NAD-dependent epimerase/dehydratase family protein [Candidatus Omnitrophota bacterium]